MSSTVDRTSRRLRLRCASISNAAANEVAAAMPSHNPAGANAAGFACPIAYNSPNAPISMTAMIRPNTSAGTSSASLSSQKNSGIAASLTQTLGHQQRSRPIGLPSLHQQLARRQRQRRDRPPPPTYASFAVRVCAHRHTSGNVSNAPSSSNPSRSHGSAAASPTTAAALARIISGASRRHGATTSAARYQRHRRHPAGAGEQRGNRHGSSGSRPLQHPAPASALATTSAAASATTSHAARCSIHATATASKREARSQSAPNPADIRHPHPTSGRNRANAQEKSRKNRRPSAAPDRPTARRR